MVFCLKTCYQVFNEFFLKMCSINKDMRSDPHCRYKMSPIIGKVEGRGNGIKTCIVNCAEVAGQLHRTPGELCKFFGCELAAQSRITDDRAIVNGAHTDKVLQQILDVFIDKFVLCPVCKLPETKLSVSNGDIYHKCKACGAKSLVDSTHKLCTFIVNKGKKAGKKKDRKANVSKKKDEKAGAGKKKDEKAGAGKKKNSFTQEEYANFVDKTNPLYLL